MLCVREVETQSASQPEVHGFCDSHGVFHAFEGPTGRRTIMAFKALEEKIAAQVEKSLASMRQEIQKDIQKLTSKSEATSWMLRQLSFEQKEFTSRLDELSLEAFESRSDLVAQIEEISREALESRVDLLARTEEISQEGFESRIDYLASLADLENKIDALPHNNLDPLDAQLEQDHVARDLDSRLVDVDMQFLDTQRTKVSELLERLRELVSVEFPHVAVQTDEAVTTAVNEMAVQTDEVLTGAKTACELDLSEHLSSTIVDNSKNLERWQYAGFSPRGFATSAFSKKPNLAAPGFSVHRPRPVARMTSSQSLPMLDM